MFIGHRSLELTNRQANKMRYRVPSLPKTNTQTNTAYCQVINPKQPYEHDYLTLVNGK